MTNLFVVKGSIHLAKGFCFTVAADDADDARAKVIRLLETREYPADTVEFRIKEVTPTPTQDSNQDSN